MRILAIETSCDETAVSVLDVSGPRERPDIKVLGNSLLSQIHLHAEYGGVYPNLAKREHQKNLPPLLEKTLLEAYENGRISEIAGAPEERVKTDAISSVVDSLDAIAVTSGPGLEPALWVGITFAEELGKLWDKPVLPTNHMEGHIYSVLYREPQMTNDQLLMTKGLELPAIALLVSGGHTELVYIKDFGDYKILGKTRDDAVGEAFDKVARILGLPYPGGPEVSRLAAVDREKNTEPRFVFPRPMLHSKDLDFSYSGLKTAVLYKVKEMGVLTSDDKENLARAFEDAAVEVLIKKTIAALDETGAHALIVGGGVSANSYLREELGKLGESMPELEVFTPTKDLTGDNSIMIALAAYVRATTNPDILNMKSAIVANGNLTLEN